MNIDEFDEYNDHKYSHKTHFIDNMNISIALAKAKFSQVIRKAESGESVTITRHGEPVVTLHAVQHNPTVPKIGSMKGKIEIAEDFDELPLNFMSAFQSEKKSK